jgi:hypothetical protein
MKNHSIRAVAGFVIAVSVIAASRPEKIHPARKNAISV